MDNDIKQKIEQLINSDKVFLFIKGTPEEPRCGFTIRIVNILHELNIKFGYFDVLSDEEIRQGVKDYANWPTYPQMWVNGKLVGGCDIVVEMYQSGGLGKLLDPNPQSS